MTVSKLAVSLEEGDIQPGAARLKEAYESESIMSSWASNCCPVWIG